MSRCPSWRCDNTSGRRAPGRPPSRAGPRPGCRPASGWLRPSPRPAAIPPAAAPALPARAGRDGRRGPCRRRRRA
eukprot:scaffold2280_cov101-Isochrysis_galbana.AAC.1